MAKRKNYSRMRRSAKASLVGVMLNEGWIERYKAPLAFRKGVHHLGRQYPKLPAVLAKWCTLKAMLEVSKAQENQQK